MASVITCLLCSWALLPLLTASEVPLPCVFPFTYKQRSYSSCTKDDASDGQLWCATTANYDTHSQWKPCALHEYGGRSNGQACVFPFVFKNRAFYTCTNEDDESGKFWCCTRGSCDKNEAWSYCADTRLNANPTGPCVFPFTYKGKSYSSCTTDGASNGKLWCSLTSHYDANPKWTYCDPSEPFPCTFPFIFKKKSYSACTKAGAGDNTLWCGTTNDYDRDSKWKACSLQEYEGNSNGHHCVFPFTYKNRTFYTCTNEDDVHARFWCAATGDHDKDKKWSFCADTRLNANPTGPCVFPFIYKGKSYSSCTTDGASNGKLWCSLTRNYDANPKWTYCDPSESLPCIFPFIYKGKSYSECTKEGAEDNILWCATTDNYDRDSKWKACSLQEYEGNSKGNPCVFPFIYGGQTFYTCTNGSSEDGRFWCATTANFDRDKKWSYCADTRLNANPTGPCIFPFIYKGQSYSSCTTDDTSSEKLWCSLTSNYDVDPKWTYCNLQRCALITRFGSDSDLVLQTADCFGDCWICLEA